MNQKKNEKPLDVPKALKQGLQAFNHAEYFEAHEIWEEAWKVVNGQEKEAFQALIQTAVGLYHHQRGKPAAGRRMAGRAFKRLQSVPGQFLGLDLGALQILLQTWTSGGKVPENLVLSRAPMGAQSRRKTDSG